MGCNPRLENCHQDEVNIDKSDCDDIGFSNFLDCFGEMMTAPVGWAEDNAVDYDIDLGTQCYLETYDIKLSETSSKSYEFPPSDFIESLPLEKIASLMIAILYIMGFQTFLKK